MKQKVPFLALFVTALMLLYAFPAMAVIPLPYKIGGTITLDGALQTAVSPDLAITLTMANGTLIQKNDGSGNNVATATVQKISSQTGALLYQIDVPIFDGTDQTLGAVPGTTATFHLNIGSVSYNVSPATFTVGASGGTNFTLPLSATSPPTVPGAPAIGTATAGNTQASVSFSAPSNGGSAITGYTVTSNPTGGVDSNVGSTSLSHIVTGLTNGTPYTFTVAATNSVGTGLSSNVSNSVIPKADQTIGAISFTPDAFTVGGTTTASATGGATDNPVTFSSLTESVCTVNGAIVTALTTGTCTIAANQAGNGSYNAAPQATNSITPGQGSQIVTFAATASKVYGNADFGAGASASTGLPITYTSDNLAVASITLDGLFVKITGAGTAVITATQAGNGNYLPASAQQTLTVDKAPLTVSANNASRSYNTADSAFSVTYGGFVYGESGSNLTGAPVITTAALIDSPVGSYPISVSQGTLLAANYSFTFADGTLAVGLASQTISFDALPAKTYGATAFDLSAIGGASANPVTFTSSNEAAATVSGSTVTIVGAGSTIITASQAGDATRYASATAQQTLTINKAPLTITVQNAQRSYGAANPTFNAIASGFVNSDTDTILTGAPVITTTATPASAVGSYTLSASQGSLAAAIDNYSFSFVTGTLAVGVASQAISFDALPAKAYGNPAFDLSATGGGSGNTVTFTSSNEAVATVSGATVTIVGAGSTTITAIQAGNENYASATTPQDLVVTKAPMTVTSQASRAYGVVNPVFTPSYSGFVNNEDAAVLQGAPSLTSSADLTSAPGGYTISTTVGNLFSNNYSFNYVDGTLTVTLAGQTINFAPTSATFGDAPVTLSATASSGLPVTFSVSSGPGNISGNTLAITGAGSISIQASQAGDANYGAAQTTKSITVAQASQTLSFSTAPVVVVGGTGTVSAISGGSTSLVVLSSTTPAVCTISGSTVTGVKAGPCSIAANQAADLNFNAAAQVTQNITVGKGSQTVSFGTAPSVIFGGTGTVSTTAGASSSPVVLSSLTPTVCTIAGSTVTGVAAGPCSIAANQTADANYNDAAQVTQDLTVGKANQTISFGTSPSVIFGGTGAVSATAGASSSPVVLSSLTPAVCTIAGSTVSGVAAGACSIAANQAADANFNAAAQVTQNLTVGKANQTISFGTLPSVIFGGTGTVSATAGASSSPVVLSSITPTFCTIAGTTVTGIAAGACSITANQAADANYNAATQAIQNITVSKANQTIGAVSFAPPAISVGGATTGSASASSSLAVTFSSTTSGVCSASGNTVTGLAAGTCTIAVNQAGNGNYNAAAPVALDITVTITVAGAPTHIVAVPGNGQATVTFSAPLFNGGSAITGYTVTSASGGTDLDAGTTATSHTMTGLTNGSPYTFTVTAINGAGSSAASAASNSVTPNILTTSIGAPSAPIAKSGNTVTFAVTYFGAENITLTAGNVTLNTTGDATGTVTISGSGTVERTVTISNLAGNGPLGISIASGSASTGGGAILATPSGASATFTVDTTSPTLTVATLDNNTVTSNDTLNISGAVSDSNGVANGKVIVNGVDEVTVTDGQFSHAVTLQAGANTITVTATDGAGNQTTDSRIVIYDHTAPIISFSAPTPAVNSVTGQQTATISGSLNKPGSVSIKVNGNTPVDATMTGNTFTAQVTLALGPNTIEVAATDTAVPVANVATVQRSVTFDNSKPAVAIADPAQDITTTLSSYLIKGTAGDQYTAITFGFSVDGVAVTPAPLLTDGSFQQNVPFITGKTYAVSVTATDEAGNTSTVQRNIVYRPLTITDALRALQLSVGIAQQTEQDKVLDVAPLVDGKPAPDGAIDISDAAILLRKTVGLVNW